MSPTCAFVSCDQVEQCCLVGGCVRERFPRVVSAPGSDLKKGAPALNGTKPARTNRDPTFIKRKRKALT